MTHRILTSVVGEPLAVGPGLLRLSPPNPNDSIFSPEDWGTSSLIGKAAGTCATEAIQAPEGLVVISHCDRCGRRLEGLVDMRLDSLLDPRSPERSVRCMKRHSDWVKNHRCGPSPRHAPLLRDFCRGTLRMARQALSEGAGAASSLYLLLPNDQVLVVDIGALPEPHPTNPTRRIVTAGLLSSIRQLLRGRRLRLEAAVTVAEAWASHEDGVSPTFAADRKEHLAVVVFTATHGRTSLYPIIRDSGVADLGPGRLGAPVHSPAGTGPLMDGLFARTL